MDESSYPFGGHDPALRHLIGGRYMGADRAEGSPNGVAGELLVRLRPSRVIAAFDLAD